MTKPSTSCTSLLAHDVQSKQAERDRIAAQVAEWIAKNGQPVCHPPTVHRAPDEGFRREQTYVPNR